MPDRQSFTQAVYNYLAPLLWWRARKPEQTTWCWCHNCRADLCSNGSDYTDDGHVVAYICATCGERSRWLFDTPCPIRLEPKA